MKSTLYLLCGIMLITASFLSPTLRADAPASQPSTTAEQTLHLYCDMLHARQGAKAIETYWDFDATFDAIFGDLMRQVSVADREQMRKFFLQVIASAYSQPVVNDLMASAAFEDFVSHDLPDHIMSVDFKIKLASGTVLPNTVYLRTIDGQWRIFDAATGHGAPMSQSLRDLYQKLPGSKSPLNFIRMMAESTEKK